MHSPDLDNLRLYGFVVCRFSEPGQDIKKNVAVDGVVPYGGIITQQILRQDVLYARIVLICLLKCFAQPLYVFRRRSNHQIDIFGSAHNPMESHSRRTNKHVLKILILECPQHP